MFCVGGVWGWTTYRGTHWCIVRYVPRLGRVWQGAVNRESLGTSATRLPGPPHLSAGSCPGLRAAVPLGVIPEKESAPPALILICPSWHILLVLETLFLMQRASAQGTPSGD